MRENRRSANNFTQRKNNREEEILFCFSVLYSYTTTDRLNYVINELRLFLPCCCFCLDLWMDHNMALFMNCPSCISLLILIPCDCPSHVCLQFPLYLSKMDSYTYYPNEWGKPSTVTLSIEEEKQQQQQLIKVVNLKNCSKSCLLTHIISSVWLFQGCCCCCFFIFTLDAIYHATRIHILYLFRHFGQTNPPTPSVT